MKTFIVRFSPDGSSRIIETVVHARDTSQARKQVKAQYPDSYIYSATEER